MATKCWDRCMSEEEKKGIEANFTDKNQYKIWSELVKMLSVLLGSI